MLKQGVRAWRSIAVLALAGCHGTDQPAPAPAPTNPSPVPEAVIAPPVVPDFPETTRSLELVRTVGVRLEPAEDGKRIGTISIDTRVGWTRTAAGRGCDKPWIEILPRGWICGDYVKPSPKPPYGQEVPQLDRGEIVPGTYGKVTGQGAVIFTLDKKKPGKGDKKKGPVKSPAELDVAKPKLVELEPIIGSLNVRDYDDVTIDGKLYWKIAQHDPQYVLATAISKHQPSHFVGARLGDETGLAIKAASTIAFVWPRGGMQQAWTTAKPTGAGAMRQLSARVLVPVYETQTRADGKATAYRIGDSEWMSPADLRVFAPGDPPPTLAQGERWIDVDLDDEILVAFEGDVAVYATLVSAGGKDTPTETGVYRMWLKESEADMKGLNGEDPYSVATVPWTQFFSPEKGLALHTAYWHDGFGHARSHGCVNLAPRDARWLYFWSDPQVPPGWTMAAGVVEAPGSIVRIRSAADPTPELKGYAKKVADARADPAP
ncbi:MAG TPA: L,D-transpeptidase [Kofleriaceae bacterium]|nr:L,D-transpeptidase [Kofleriaceae bacterium]